MPQSEKGPTLDPEIAWAMAELLDQTGREPISPRLRALARQLETALAAVRDSRANDQGNG